MKIKILHLLLTFGAFALFTKCDKKGDPPPADPCAGVTINVLGTKVDATSGSNGSITITSPLGSGFTFSLNGAAAVSNPIFSGLAPGTYTITARNASNCTGSAQFIINSDACAGKTIVVSTPTIINFTPCSTTADGSVTVAATGSTGFTFNIGGGTFQSSATFNNLAAGNYVVGARDVDGCVKTANVTVGNRPAGPLFTAVRGVIQANCVSCHGATSPSGGVSLATDCDIVNRWDRINARAVNGTPSFMPTSGAMPISERNKITAWINAGRRFTD